MFAWYHHGKPWVNGNFLFLSCGWIEVQTELKQATHLYFPLRMTTCTPICSSSCSSHSVCQVPARSPSPCCRRLPANTACRRRAAPSSPGGNGTPSPDVRPSDDPVTTKLITCDAVPPVPRAKVASFLRCFSGSINVNSWLALLAAALPNVPRVPRPRVPWVAGVAAHSPAPSRVESSVCTAGVLRAARPGMAALR